MQTAAGLLVRNMFETAEHVFPTNPSRQPGRQSVIGPAKSCGDSSESCRTSKRGSQSGHGLNCANNRMRQNTPFATEEQHILTRTRALNEYSLPRSNSCGL